MPAFFFQRDGGACRSTPDLSSGINPPEPLSSQLTSVARQGSNGRRSSSVQASASLSRQARACGYFRGGSRSGGSSMRSSGGGTSACNRSERPAFGSGLQPAAPMAMTTTTEANVLVCMGPPGKVTHASYPPGHETGDFAFGGTKSQDSLMDQIIQFVTAPDGVRLAYARSGTGPAMLKTANWLNHLEFDWQSPVWREWFTLFSTHHTLYRYDQRGSGLSDWVDTHLSFDHQVSDLECIADAARLERCALLGISQGASV